MNRRTFVTGPGLGTCLCGAAFDGTVAQSGSASTRREVFVDGQRIRTIDIHCHCSIPGTLGLVQGSSLERRVRSTISNQANNPPAESRIAHMDLAGIDVQVMSINPWWFEAEYDLSRRIVDLQNSSLMKICQANPERLFAFASVALQFPELAAEQLDVAMKQQGLRGAAIGCSINGVELSSSKFDPFWEKAEERK
jgi:aminocarboxymuconate-semialdehyde decarboxylase